MSQTSTIPQTRTALSRSSSILLSPSKRRKLDDDKPRQQSPKREGGNEPVPTEITENAEKAQPTPAELYRWTFTRAAITPCFVRDVFEMKASGFRDMEFFWLGRIPCRTVRLIGVLVGVTVWDRRTIYTIDDGTAVLDCALAHAQVVPPSPVKPKVKVTAPVGNGTKRSGPSYSDYLLSTRKMVPTTTSAPPSRAEPPPPPKPVARVGQSVRVVGRVVSRHDTRILLVDEISRTSCNDEPSHWLSVSDLHRTTYYPSEALPPFVPPPLPAASANPAYSRPCSPSKRAATQEPTTPASVRFTAPSAMTSPSTSVATSSPASSTTGELKQIRLRHPSRLHTRDLTSNTFRIYVKHYMDNAPPPAPRRRRSEARSVSPSPTPRASRSQKGVDDTPTKTGCTKRAAAADATPRPSRRRRLEGHTPRASQVPPIESDVDSSDEEDIIEGDDQMYGFTLSHLRRVPELSLLARRVIAADARRREKEERRKAKEQAFQSKGKGKAPASSSSASRSTATETQVPTGAAVKKLYKQAIRTLFQEGDIVLWSGPVRPLPVPSLDPMLPASSASQLWRANTSTSSTISSASTSSRSQPNYEEWDDEVLSDPQPNEEAYVPLTPAYFSRVLEDAIRNMAREKSSKTKGPQGETTPRPKPASKSIVERMREQEKERGAGPPPGPTKEELLTWLRNSDERWARVGEWTVQEALEWGRREGRLWCIGKGRWEVCE